MTEAAPQPKQVNGNGNGHGADAEPATPPASMRWTWDRRIPLALIITLAMQTLVFGAAWGALTTTVGHQGATIEKLEAAAAAVLPIREDMAALKVQVNLMTAQQARIEGKLDALAER